jgi:hypothetical protein
MQKLEPRHCGDRDGPPDQDKEEPGRDTKGRKIQEESKLEDKKVIEEDANHNATPDEQQLQETQVQDKEEEDGGNKEQQDNKSEHTGRDRQNRKTKKMRRTRNATI